MTSLHVGAVLTTLLLSLGINTQLLAQVDWIKYTTRTDLGTHFSGDAQAHDMAIDASDNIFLTGNFGGAANFDDTTTLGQRDPVFLAKYQPDGGVAWVREIGGNSNNDGNTVAVNDSGHVYVSGVFQQTNTNTILDFGDFTLAGDREENLFLAKADAAGTFLWAVAIIVDDLNGPDQNITPWDMIVDEQGDIYLTGKMLGSVNIEGVKYNTDPLDIDNNVMFLAKFRPDGSLDWFRHVHNQTGTGYSIGHRLALASNGDFFLSGEYNNVSYDGDTLPNVGETNAEKFVARFNPAGDLLWIQPMASRLADQKSFHIGVDDKDNVYTMMERSSNLYFSDTTVLFPYEFEGPHLLLKFDGNGHRLFFKETAYPSVNGANNIVDVNLTTRDDGTTFFSGTAGAFADHFIFGNDSLDLRLVPNSYISTPFISAFDANGNALGVGIMPDEFLDGAFDYEIKPATMLTDHGKLFVTGYMTGDYLFGNDTVQTANVDQLFLAQVDPDFLNTTTSIERMPERLAFQVYPNPAHDRFFVKLNDWQQVSAKMEMGLFDLSGKLLKRQKIQAAEMAVDVSDLPAGYYVLILRDEAGSYAKKLQVWK